MYIAFKECSETNNWLELLYLSNYFSKEEFEYLYNDSEELFKLLSSITKTMKEK